MRGVARFIFGSGPRQAARARVRNSLVFNRPRPRSGWSGPLHEDRLQAIGAMLTDRPIAMAMIPSSIVAGLELGRQGLSYQDSISDATQDRREKFEMERKLIQALRRALSEQSAWQHGTMRGYELGMGDFRQQMREQLDPLAPTDEPQWFNPNWLNEYGYRPREESQE